MSAPSNPHGLHTVTPYLVIRDVPSTLAFAQKILGATLRGEPQLREDGTVKHAELAIGDSVVMLGEPMPGIDAMPGMLYVYVDDCDATYARALEAGAHPVLAPAVYPHGDRYGGVRDEGGNVWWLVTHVGRPEAGD